MSDDSKAHWLKLREGLPDHEVRLGRATGGAYVSDPRMIAFIAARYKFVSKMLEDVGTVLEVGCGDAFGLPIVAQTVDKVIATDIDIEQLAVNAAGCHARNVGFQYHDFRFAQFARKVNAIYMIDVIEHIYESEQDAFLGNVVESLDEDGILMIGTPNVEASKHASAHSRDGHVNLQSADDLYEIGDEHFRNFFQFGQNDEVIHTGFAPMCNYLWVLCVGPRQ
jgi:cyclopropane fatty-acyl-phospholipid synthase-like methyltransferase